jgi:hypothetical protein
MVMIGYFLDDKPTLSKGWRKIRLVKPGMSQKY